MRARSDTRLLGLACHSLHRSTHTFYTFGSESGTLAKPELPYLTSILSLMLNHKRDVPKGDEVSIYSVEIWNSFASVKLKLSSSKSFGGHHSENTHTRSFVVAHISFRKIPIVADLGSRPCPNLSKHVHTCHSTHQSPFCLSQRVPSTPFSPLPTVTEINHSTHVNATTLHLGLAPKTKSSER